jgi:hypothetical protein
MAFTSHSRLRVMVCGKGLAADENGKSRPESLAQSCGGCDSRSPARRRHLCGVVVAAAHARDGYRRRGGANDETGIRYREALAREGVKLVLQPTTGSLENLRQIRDSPSGVSVGFIQGDITTRKESPELESRLAPYFMSRCGSSAALVSKGCKVDEFRLALKETAGERWRCKYRQGPGSIVLWANYRGLRRKCGSETDRRRNRRGVHCDRLGVPRSSVFAQCQRTSRLVATSMRTLLWPSIPFCTSCSCPPGLSIFPSSAHLRTSCYWRQKPVLPCVRTCTQPCSTCCSMLPFKFIPRRGFSRK